MISEETVSKWRLDFALDFIFSVVMNWNKRCMFFFKTSVVCDEKGWTTLIVGGEVHEVRKKSTKAATRRKMLNRTLAVFSSSLVSKTLNAWFCLSQLIPDSLRWLSGSFRLSFENHLATSSASWARIHFSPNPQKAHFRFRSFTCCHHTSITEKLITHFLRNRTRSTLCCLQTCCLLKSKHFTIIIATNSLRVDIFHVWTEV